MWLFACGVSEPMMMPNPPPGPPPTLSQASEDEVTLNGVVVHVDAESRTWVQDGDGQRVIAHLPPAGVLTLDDKVVLVSDLAPGAEIRTHGRQQGDLVIVMAAQLKPAAVLPPPDVAPATVETPALESVPPAPLPVP